MTTADNYLKKAAELSAQARLESSAAYKAELERLSQCYRNLAALADSNDHTNIVYETPAAPRDR